MVLEGSFISQGERSPLGWVAQLVSFIFHIIVITAATFYSTGTEAWLPSLGPAVGILHASSRHSLHVYGVATVSISFTEVAAEATFKKVDTSCTQGRRQVSRDHRSPDTTRRPVPLLTCFRGDSAPAPSLWTLSTGSGLGCWFPGLLSVWNAHPAPNK